MPLLTSINLEEAWTGILDKSLTLRKKIKMQRGAGRGGGGGGYGGAPVPLPLDPKSLKPVPTYPPVVGMPAALKDAEPSAEDDQLFDCVEELRKAMQASAYYFASALKKTDSTYYST